MYRRVLQNLNDLNSDGVEGLVMATEINTSIVDKPENEWELELFDLEKDYDWEPIIGRKYWDAASKEQQKWFQKLKDNKRVDQKQILAREHVVTHVVTIGKARAKVCRVH